MTTSSQIDPKLFKEISCILNQSQDSIASHAKLIAKCQALFKESQFNRFFETFTVVMQGIMVTMVKNPNLDRIIEFIAKFSSSLTNKPSPASTSTDQQQDNTQKTLVEDEISDDECENEFLTHLIDYLIENNKSNSDAVRYRCCHILSKIMSFINNEQFIDEDLYDRLCDSLLERLKDINSRVQVQAISGIYRLQDPNDRDCRVMKALLFLLTYDPNWQVRYQSLSHVAFSKVTLPDIIDRVRDPHPLVRRKALMILSEKVLIKFISIEKRLFILNYSLKDDDKNVLETCTRKLLPSWLALKENDMCKLLKALDVVDSTETIELMLNKMNDFTSINDFIQLYLSEEKHLIPLEKLDAENCYYWSWLCQKCKENEDEENLDKLLPNSLTEYCQYIQESMKKFEQDKLEKPQESRLHIENVFILKQLIKMLMFVDLSDAHGKKTLTQLLHDLFAQKQYTYLFDQLMKVYKRLIPNLQTRINNLVELISDLKEPQPIQTQQAEEASNEETEERTSMNGQDAETQMSAREIALKISELKFQRFKLKDDFDNLYKEIKNVDKQIDMNKLGELRNQIKDCEDQITHWQNVQQNGLRKNNKQQTSQSADAQTNDHAEQNQVQQIEFDPIESAYHCLQLSICLLQDLELKQLTPQLRSLCDTLVIPNIGSVNEELRALAVRALNLLCILKIELAQRFLPLLLQIIQSDKKDVVLEAFKSCINLIMAFSMEKLIADDEAMNDVEEKQKATTRILSVLTSLLDHEDGDLYTVAVEGFCKLYMTGHILSAKLFSKLLLMYYSPITENDVKLKAILSTFLPNFAFFRSVNQLCVEESFMITIKCLINAPADNYLNEIDLFKVVDILFHLTNPRNLMLRNKNSAKSTATTNNICHENIVKSICYEILKDDKNLYKIKTYLKIVSMADLSDADYLSLKDLKQLADDVNDHIDDKLVKKMSQKFVEQVNEILIGKPEYKRDLEKSDQEPNNQSNNDEDNNTLVNNEIENQIEESEANKSSNIIDPAFPKLKKKASKQNSTVMSTISMTTNNKEDTVQEEENDEVEPALNTSTRRRSLRINRQDEQAIIKSSNKIDSDQDIINDSISQEDEREEEKAEQTVVSRNNNKRSKSSPQDSSPKSSNERQPKAIKLTNSAEISPRTKKQLNLKEVSVVLKNANLTGRSKATTRMATRRSQSNIVRTDETSGGEEPPVKQARKTLTTRSSASSLMTNRQKNTSETTTKKKTQETLSEKTDEKNTNKNLRSTSTSRTSPRRAAVASTENKTNLIKEFSGGRQRSNRNSK